MDTLDWLHSFVSFGEDFPDELVAPVADWYSQTPRMFRSKMPSTTVKHCLSVEKVHFLLIEESRELYDDPVVKLSIVKNGVLGLRFVFVGKVEALHLSRSGKSVILKTERPHYLNGDPWIIYRQQRYIFTLDGEKRLSD